MALKLVPPCNNILVAEVGEGDDSISLNRRATTTAAQASAAALEADSGSVPADLRKAVEQIFSDTEQKAA